LVNDNSPECDRTSPYKIDLKAFLVEWRILQKSYTQHKNRYKYFQGVNPNSMSISISIGNSPPKDKTISSRNVTENNSPLALKTHDMVSPIKFNKKERSAEIKDLLVKSIRLKMKLQNQIESLKKHVVIDEDIIVEHLKSVKIIKN
jgi:hypothetical protein